MITVTENTSWQALNVAEELALYYNQRARFLGLADIATPTDATGVCAFIASLQTLVIAEAFYEDAVNPSESWAGITEANDYPDTYSTLGLSQLYSDAGLPDGFRRCTTTPADWTDYDDPAYSYGVAVDETDLIGPFLFVDLQNMIKAVKVFKVESLRFSDWSLDSMTLSYDDYYTTTSDTPEPPPDTEISYSDNSGVYETFDGAGVNYSALMETDPNNAFIDYHAYRAYHKIFRFNVEPKLNARGNAYKEIEIYGRVKKLNETDSFWSYPYGVESTSTKKLAEGATSDSDNGYTGLVGGSEFTDTDDIFLPDMPSAYGDEVGPYSTKIYDAVARIEVN